MSESRGGRFEISRGHCRADFPRCPSKIDQASEEVRRQLADVLGVPADEIPPCRGFTGLIPSRERRRVWRELQEAGVDLPELRLSSRVLVAIALVVLFPVALLGVLFSWSIVLCLAELHLLAYKVTRPWAIHPPMGCETPHEAAVHVTPFRMEDYRAGLWSHEEIGAKVRLVICRCLDIPYASIHEGTRLADICDC
jgi:hypothetical protein